MAEPLSDVALDQIFRTARSYNGYADKPVSTEQLHDLWELMKMAPTSTNQMPARLIWLTTPEAKARLAKYCLGTNGDKVLQAPVSVIIASDTHFHENLPWLFPPADAKSWFAGNDTLRETSAFRNSTLQGAYFIIAARAIGLDTGPMSGFDNAGVDQEFFGDEPNWKSNFISTLGYGDPASIFDRLPRPDFDVFNRIL